MLPYNNNNNNIITNDEVLRLKHKQLKNIKSKMQAHCLNICNSITENMPSIFILHLVDCRDCLMNFYAHKIKFNIRQSSSPHSAVATKQHLNFDI